MSSLERVDLRYRSKKRKRVPADPYDMASSDHSFISSGSMISRPLTDEESKHTTSPLEQQQLKHEAMAQLLPKQQSSRVESPASSFSLPF